MTSIGGVKLKDGTEVRLGIDLSWHSENKLAELEFNLRFDPQSDEDEISAGFPLGHKTVSRAAKAVGGAAMYPPSTADPDTVY